MTLLMYFGVCFVSILFQIFASMLISNIGLQCVCVCVCEREREKYPWFWYQVVGGFVRGSTLIETAHPGQAPLA